MKCYKKSQIQPWPKLHLIEIIGKYNQLSLKSQLQINVRAILSMLDSTAFCILFISTSLLLLPTILYIVVSISRDHSSSASMMMLCCFNLQTGK